MTANLNVADQTCNKNEQTNLLEAFTAIDSFTPIQQIGFIFKSVVLYMGSPQFTERPESVRVEEEHLIQFTVSKLCDMYHHIEQKRS